MADPEDGDVQTQGEGITFEEMLAGERGEETRTANGPRAISKPCSMCPCAFGCPRTHADAGRQAAQNGCRLGCELDRQVGEAIDIYVNDRLVARGEIVLVEGRLGVTIPKSSKPPEGGNPCVC